MGTYYTARALIGYKISKANVTTKKMIPSCECNPPADVIFCPRCGVKVCMQEQERNKQEWWDFTEFAYEHLPAGYHFDQSEFIDAFWIGYGCSCEHGEAKMLPLVMGNFITVKGVIKTLLKPYTSTGLFELDDSQFGVWLTNFGH